MKFPIVNTKNFVLRKLRNEDLEDFLEVSYYNGRKANNVRQAREVMLRIENDFFRGESIHWAIAEKKGDKLVGSCGFYHAVAKLETEVGFAVVEAKQNQGIMSEVLPEMLKFCGKSLTFETIFAVTESSNAPSLALIKKCGFVFNKKLKQNCDQYKINF